MKHYEFIEHAIEERWGRDPAVPICMAILNYVAARPEQQSVALQYADIAELTGKSFEEEDLQRALTILVSWYQALEMRLVFFDEKGGAHYLDDEEQEHFIESGKLADPRNGELVDNAKAHVYPYFVAVPQQLLQEQAN